MLTPLELLLGKPLESVCCGEPLFWARGSRVWVWCAQCRSEYDVAALLALRALQVDYEVETTGEET